MTSYPLVYTTQHPIRCHPPPSIYPVTSPASSVPNRQSFLLPAANPPVIRRPGNAPMLIVTPCDAVLQLAADSGTLWNTQQISGTRARSFPGPYATLSPSLPPCVTPWLPAPAGVLPGPIRPRHSSPAYLGYSPVCFPRHFLSL